MWSQILESLSSGPHAWAVQRPQEVMGLQRQLFTFRGVSTGIATGRLGPRMTRYGRLAAALYSAASESTGCDVLVDGSKWPFDPTLLQSNTRVQFAVHLVRDPRDVAVSWASPKLFPDTGEPMPRFGPIHTSLSWMARTVASEWIVKRLGTHGLTLRYEDFVQDPSETVAAIGRLVGSEGWCVELDRSGSVTMPRRHTIMGNPSRFSSGRVRIASPVRTEGQRLVAMLTWPWRLRFGYE